jgi:hypothetical protein
VNEQAQPTLLTHGAIAAKLGTLYRQARILRRLLRLLEDAQRHGLALTTADKLPAPIVAERKGDGHG